MKFIIMNSEELLKLLPTIDLSKIPSSRKHMLVDFRALAREMKNYFQAIMDDNYQDLRLYERRGFDLCFSSTYVAWPRFEEIMAKFKLDEIWEKKTGGYLIPAGKIEAALSVMPKVMDYINKNLLEQEAIYSKCTTREDLSRFLDNYENEFYGEWYFGPMAGSKSGNPSDRSYENAPYWDAHVAFKFILQMMKKARYFNQDCVVTTGPDARGRQFSMSMVISVMDKGRIDEIIRNKELSLKKMFAEEGELNIIFYELQQGSADRAALTALLERTGALVPFTETKSLVKPIPDSKDKFVNLTWNALRSLRFIRRFESIKQMGFFPMRLLPGLPAYYYHNGGFEQFAEYLVTYSKYSEYHSPESGWLEYEEEVMKIKDLFGKLLVEYDRNKEKYHSKFWYLLTVEEPFKS